MWSNSSRGVHTSWIPSPSRVPPSAWLPTKHANSIFCLVHHMFSEDVCGVSTPKHSESIRPIKPRTLIFISLFRNPSGVQETLGLPRDSSGFLQASIWFAMHVQNEWRNCDQTAQARHAPDTTCGELLTGFVSLTREGRQVNLNNYTLISLAIVTHWDALDGHLGESCLCSCVNLTQTCIPTRSVQESILLPR